MLLSDSTIDQVRQLDIVSVIARYVTLKSRGHKHEACCPFHDEKSPSFHVNPTKYIFKCFGCGAAGDGIGFVMKFKKLEFIEAVEEIAGDHGIALERQAQSPEAAAVAAEEQRNREAVRIALGYAAAYFAGTGRPVAPAAGKQDGATPTTSVVKGISGLIAPWGPANDFPQQVLAKIALSTIIGPVLDWKTRATYGKGIVYGKVIGFQPDGTEIFQRVNDHVVKEFFRKSNLARFGFEGLQGLHFYANAFPELIISRGRSEITSIAIQDTPFCRYSVQVPGMAVPEWVYISANWPMSQPGDGYTDHVPVLDPYYRDVDALRADKRGFKYIYPLSLPSPGQAMYQLAAWNPIIKSGWLDVAQAVPEFKKQLFKNQLSIKYLIEADIRYWSWRYPDWSEKTEAQRKQIIGDELEAFERTMAGTEGAGKSIMTITMPDPQNPGATIRAFTVTAIDDKIKSGLYIEDSQEASSHVYTALQVDPTLSGISPGKGMGAGSGSDKRVAFNAFVATHSFHQDLLLEVLNLVRDYNGWDPELEFRFLNPQIATLDAPKEVPAAPSNAA